MQNYDASTYGDRIAERYDELHAGIDPAAAVAALAALARGGPALELGIGTGRVALPLAAQGVEVHGIEASPAMAARLRAKPGGERIPVSLGDFAEVSVEGTFTLVFVVFSTFFGLTTQEEQVRCFGNVARHLREDGVFVIEAFVPDMTRNVRGQNIQTVAVSADEVRLDVTRYDAVNQRVTSQHVLLSEAGVKLYPVVLRYVWPSELDLMARLAGLRLRERWGGWDREPFTEGAAGTSPSTNG